MLGQHFTFDPSMLPKAGEDTFSLVDRDWVPEPPSELVVVPPFCL